MASNVDDLIYGNEPEAEPVMKKILDHFQVVEEESGACIFCVGEVTPLDVFSIKVIVKDHTEKIEPVSYDNTRTLNSSTKMKIPRRCVPLYRRWPGVLPGDTIPLQNNLPTLDVARERYSWSTPRSIQTPACPSLQKDQGGRMR